MALVGGDGGADLCANALVGAEQGEVAVGGAAGDDADEAGVVEVPEAADDASVEGLEIGEGCGKEGVPEAGEVGVVLFAGLGEEGLIFLGGDDLAVEIAGELGEKDGVGELLEENRGQVEVAMEANAVALEVARTRRRGR